MKKNIIIWGLLWALCGLGIQFTGCSRMDDTEYAIKRVFLPISGLQGTASYGRANFTWELPDSLSSLFYIEMIRKDNEGNEHREVIPRFIDSLCVTDLLPKNYTFQFISHSEGGEKIENAPVTLTILPWDQEPPADVLDLYRMVAENSLILEWKNPIHPTYNGVTFKLYLEESLVDSIFVTKDELPKYIFKELKYNTDNYRLEYYSRSELDITSSVKKINFNTGDVAPVTPEIKLLKDEFYAAHCAEINWDATEDMDSVLVRYVDMNGENRQYCFAADRWGYISLLPGGTLELQVQAKGKNGTWSFPQQQKIKTLLTDETYLPKIPNGPYSHYSKLSEVMYQTFGRGTSAEFKKDNNWLEQYSYKEMAELKDFTMMWEIYSAEEIHYFVNLEILAIKSYGSMTATQVPTVEEFAKLIDRLPKIKEFHVVGGYPIFKKLEERFTNHPKIIFKKI